MFKHSFKTFKSAVLKATCLGRETKQFCDTYCLSKILFKNMSVLLCIRTFCFLSFGAEVIGT